MPPSDDGVEKSAVLLISLGENQAAEVLKHLGPREVQKLGHAMSTLKTVPRAKVEGVLDEFHQIVTERVAVHTDTDTYNYTLTQGEGQGSVGRLTFSTVH